jgi:hypothetical protein
VGVLAEGVDIMDEEDSEARRLGNVGDHVTPAWRFALDLVRASTASVIYANRAANNEHTTTSATEAEELGAIEWRVWEGARESEAMQTCVMHVRRWRANRREAEETPRGPMFMTGWLSVRETGQSEERLAVMDVRKRKRDERVVHDGAVVRY